MTWYPLYRRLGGPQGQSGQVQKISPPPGFDPRTVWPLASRYTDYGIRPTYIHIYIHTHTHTPLKIKDTNVFHGSQPICMVPEKHENKQWDVLESIYNSSACQPVQRLAAVYQVTLFILGSILLITVGTLTYCFQIMRKITY